LSKSIAAAAAFVRARARLSYWFKTRKNMLTDRYNIRRKKRDFMAFVNLLLPLLQRRYYDSYSYDWMRAHTYM